MDAYDEEDDGEEFEDLELLEQIEAEALKQHAATQAQRCQGGQPAQQPTQPTVQRDQLQNEIERLQKLQRSLQGELSVLRDNHARSKAEQDAQIAKVNAARQVAEDEAHRRVQALQEENQRLNHAMTFQRQELRDARSRPPQQSPSKGSSLARQVTVETAFPPLAETSMRHSPSRKRRRMRKGSASDDEMDFDRVQIGPVAVSSPTKSPVKTKLLSNSRQHSPSPSVAFVEEDATMQEPVQEPVQEPDLPNGSSTRTEKALTDKLELCTWLCALTAAPGGSLLHLLDHHALTAKPGASTLMSVIANSIGFETAVDLAGAFIRILGEHLHAGQPLRLEIIRLIQSLLRAFPKNLALLLASDIGETNALAFMAQASWLENASSEEAQELHRQRLTLFLNVALLLDHENPSCQYMLVKLPASFWAFALEKERSTEHFVMAAKLLAALAHQEAHIGEDSIILDLLTASLELRAGSKLVQLLPQQIVALQCLYAISIYQSTALGFFKTSRMLVPRLARCIYQHLELTYMETTRQAELGQILESCLRFYHLLLNNMEAGQAERHWLLPQCRATHIVAMTRISFAEDEDSFSMEMVDMARDLLEWCISPEEGEEIHAVLS